MTAQWTVRFRRVPVGRRDRGTATLETVALVPLLVLVGSLLLQLGVAVWTTVAADTAARSAARAYTLQRDELDAANSSLPGVLSVTREDVITVPSANGDDVRVTLRIKIPRVSILPEFTVLRDAVMPNIRS